jgi:putative ABC transport system substrate-binding protein
VKRREFITLVGGAAAAWPLVGWAQQSAMPVIGILSAVSPGPFAQRVAAFQKGLSETGFIEGRNVAMEYRWAEERYDRLAGMAADLVGHRVVLILALNDAAAFAAKAATKTIPIVVTSGGYPVRAGLASSLNRPDGNITGVSWFGADLMLKQFSLVRQLVPDGIGIALLVDQNFPDAVSQVPEVEKAARTLRLHLVVLNARTEADIDAAFQTLVRERAGALVVSAGGFLNSRRAEIIALAARYRIPAIYPAREFAGDGGLISYGNNIQDSMRQAGIYAGRILKGEKPADLPIERATKFELIINLKAAKALGLTVPPTLGALADEVIE